MPATAPVPTYAVQIVGDDIQISWGAPAPSTTETAPKNPHTGQALPKEVTATPAKPAAAPVAARAVPVVEGAAPSQQELAVRSALETVMDPEINLSVIDLGLIREVHVGSEKTEIKMMLTTPFCPYAPQLMADVKQAALSVVPQECEVDILPDAWSPDLMPDPSLLGYSF
jgi:metal-sulfur cluster biosynthetic enzyme